MFDIFNTIFMLAKFVNNGSAVEGTLLGSVRAGGFSPSWSPLAGMPLVPFSLSGPEGTASDTPCGPALITIATLDIIGTKGHKLAEVFLRQNVMFYCCYSSKRFIFERLFNCRFDGFLSV
jgi:hypothetical protein